MLRVGFFIFKRYLPPPSPGERALLREGGGRRDRTEHRAGGGDTTRDGTDDKTTPGGWTTPQAEPHTHLVPAQPLPHRLIQLRIAGAAGDQHVGVDVPGGSTLAHVCGEWMMRGRRRLRCFASSLRRGTAHRLREGKNGGRRCRSPGTRGKREEPGAPGGGRYLPQPNAPDGGRRLSR